MSTTDIKIPLRHKPDDIGYRLIELPPDLQSLLESDNPPVFVSPHCLSSQSSWTCHCSHKFSSFPLLQSHLGILRNFSPPQVSRQNLLSPPEKHLKFRHPTLSVSLIYVFRSGYSRNFYDPWDRRAWACAWACRCCKRTAQEHWEQGQMARNVWKGTIVATNGSFIFLVFFSFFLFFSIET